MHQKLICFGFNALLKPNCFDFDASPKNDHFSFDACIKIQDLYFTACNNKQGTTVFFIFVFKFKNRKK